MGEAGVNGVVVDRCSRMMSQLISRQNQIVDRANDQLIIGGL